MQNNHAVAMNTETEFGRYRHDVARQDNRNEFARYKRGLTTNLKIHIDNMSFMMRSRLGLELLETYSIEYYLNYFTQENSGGPYTQFPGYLQDWFTMITENAGDRVLQCIHRLALLQLMARSLSALETATVSVAINDAVEKWYRDICMRIDDPDYRFDASDDFFKKDIQIAALRMWPTSSVCHFERSGIPRAFLLKGGWQQACMGLKSLFVDLKGHYRDLFEIHLEDRRVNPHFIEAGWRRMYMELAAELALHPEIPGVFAQGWFWDPAVAEINRNTEYLRRLPEAGGASFFRLAEDHDPNHPSLKNKKRRRLYTEGNYVPTWYLMIWPRDKLLEWFQQEKDRQ